MVLHQWQQILNHLLDHLAICVIVETLCLSKLVRKQHSVVKSYVDVYLQWFDSTALSFGLNFSVFMFHQTLMMSMPNLSMTLSNKYLSYTEWMRSLWYIWDILCKYYCWCSFSFLHHILSLFHVVNGLVNWVCVQLLFHTLGHLFKNHSVWGRLSMGRSSQA